MRSQYQPTSLWMAIAGPLPVGRRIALQHTQAGMYHRNMARGWESKSVEDQQLMQDSTIEENTAAMRLRHQEFARQTRIRQELELKKERILCQRTSNPVRRAALEAALADVESELAHLG